MYIHIYDFMYYETASSSAATGKRFIVTELYHFKFFCCDIIASVVAKILLQFFSRKKIIKVFFSHRKTATKRASIVAETRSFLLLNGDLVSNSLS
jgi:hypothetical protein